MRIVEWMQQLFFAIEAPYILGTRGSGWNRMIDELRCIWVDCRTPYMEVGPFEDWVSSSKQKRQSTRCRNTANRVVAGIGPL